MSVQHMKEDAMTDLCDVCKKNPMIGVASTSIPFSCAFCRECAQQGADPEWIFVYYLEDVAGGSPENIAKDRGLVTYSDGQYVDFHTWANKHIEDARKAIT